MMLDLSHIILLNEIKEITERNMTIELCHKIKAITIGGYRFYFYKTEEEAHKDYEIAERYIRLKNS